MPQSTEPCFLQSSSASPNFRYHKRKKTCSKLSSNTLQAKQKKTKRRGRKISEKLHRWKHTLLLPSHHRSTHTIAGTSLLPTNLPLYVPPFPSFSCRRKQCYSSSSLCYDFPKEIFENMERGYCMYHSRRRRDFFFWYVLYFSIIIIYLGVYFNFVFIYSSFFFLCCH